VDLSLRKIEMKNRFFVRSGFSISFGFVVVLLAQLNNAHIPHNQNHRYDHKQLCERNQLCGKEEPSNRT